MFSVVDSTPPTIYGTRPTIEGSALSTLGVFTAAPTLVTLWCVRGKVWAIMASGRGFLCAFNEQAVTA